MTNQFYPPKDVQDNPFSWSEWSAQFWLSLLLLILCGAWLYLRNRLKNNKPIITHIRIVKRVPAHEKALNQINVIKQQHVENQETQKAYYTQLTNTLREYIVSRFGFNAMEMTSMEPFFLPASRHLLIADDAWLATLFLLSSRAASKEEVFLLLLSWTKKKISVSFCLVMSS